jgi:hypothetical protein
MLVGRYTTITTPAVQQVNTDLAAYVASEGHDLAAAEAALRAAVAAGTGLDASLARFPFPPAVSPIAEALARLDRARAELIARQARSSSLSQLRSFNHRLRAAGAAIRTELNLLRRALATRPAANQEP